MWVRTVNTCVYVWGGTLVYSRACSPSLRSTLGTYFSPQDWDRGDLPPNGLMRLGKPTPPIDQRLSHPFHYLTYVAPTSKPLACAIHAPHPPQSSNDPFCTLVTDPLLESKRPRCTYATDHRSDEPPTYRKVPWDSRN